MSKIAYITQPAGLGDILFCQKIARRAIEEFNCEKVIWDVLPEYHYLQDYIINNNVFFNVGYGLSLGRKIIDNDEMLYIPLLTSDRVVSYPDPRAHGYIKYSFFNNTDWSDWKNYFEIKRNYERENKLIDKLGLDINEKYNLINPNFGTPPNFIKNDNISPNNEYKNIYMDILPDINIFDWLTILENATEIHTMETSLYYILEKLNIENNVYIYSKYTYQMGSKDNYEYMKSHCSDKWNYV